jgi:vacuolar protein sorting-associated protein 33A
MGSTQTIGEIEKRQATAAIESVIFLLKPKKTIVQRAYMATKILEKIGIIDYNYMFIPKGMTYLSEQFLISNPEKVSSINMSIIPFDKDVLSLEIYDSFFNCIQQEDFQYITQSYEAILRLEKIYGTIKFKFACGPNAVNVLNRLLKVSTELSRQFQISDLPVYDGYSSTMKGGEIQALVIIDRKVDLVTPFCIQQTYEGILDEYYGINATNLDVEASIVKGSVEEEKVMGGEKKPKMESMTLKSDSDLIFEEVRDLNFVVLESKFSQRVIDIDTIFKDKDKPQNVDDIEKYIERVKKMKITQVKDKLTHHINLAHNINPLFNNFDFNDCLMLEQNIIFGDFTKEMIETLQLLMTRGVDSNSILRMLALASVTQSGIKEKIYQELFKQYIDCYGFDEMNTLLNMEEMGLFMK